MGKHIGLLVAGIFAYVGLTGVAEAACSSSGVNQITCTGGQAASVVNSGSAGTAHASNYPATLAVSGAPAGATIASLVLRLNGYTSLSNGSADVGIVLEGPLTGAAKPNLQVIRGGGTGSTHQTNATIAFQDGATQIPDLSTAWTGTGTWAPTARDGTARDNEASPTYTPTGPSAFNSAAPLGTATLTSVFAGKTVNGTWNVYLANDSGNLFGLSSNINFTSFDLIINYSGASSPSTTTLTPNPTTAYTSAASSSVVLTASVTAGATGTVTFKEGNTVLSCTVANPVTLAGGSAACTTSFAAEGLHVLTAVYSGDGTFVTSSGSANVYTQNHSANVGTTYCNTGSIAATGTSDVVFSSTKPYPSVIFVGDGTNTNLTNSVNTLSLTLKNFSAPAAGTLAGVHMLLVAPDGTHAYDFFSNTGNSASAGDYTFHDGATQVSSGPISPGTYGPTADGPPPDSFTPGPPAPAPQVPGSFVYASPVGSSTFQTAFSGAAASGAWKLFLYNFIGSGINATAAGGWCLTISEATGHPTTTVVTSSAAPNAALGASVSFQATVAGSPTPTVGTVTFTENGSPLTGAPNSGIATVVNGLASISTSGLPEGDHTITASYHDSTNTFNDSFGTVTIRIDKATNTPTLSGSTWSYCNTGVVTIPAGTITLNDIGPAGPNPSNVLVTNLPGTISSANIKLNGFSHFHPVNLQSLLVGPNGASALTAAQTFDFFTNAGGINSFGPQTTTFSDTGGALTAGAPPAASSQPGSFGATPPTYTASPFFTLPGSFQRASTAGAFTFNTGTRTASAGGVYTNTNPNGLWSLYFDQTSHQPAGGGMTGGWCMNFIVNPVTGAGSTGHVGPAPNNHMTQGGTGSVTFSLHNNGDANANGSTGDPDGLHGLQVSGTLPAGLTFGTVPTGSPWSCTAPTSTTLNCKSSSAIAAGSNYPLLTLPVNVASNALASVTVSGFTFSGGGMTSGTFSSDTITIDPPPSLAIVKAHTGTFTQGQTATWTLQVSNQSGTAAGATDGTTVSVVDTFPTGYTLASSAGTNWSCTGTSTVTCTTTAVVAGAGANFNLITLGVNVPANSAVSVTNNAKAFGGGDPIHTNSANGAAASDAVTVVQVPASISLTTGNNQSVAVNTAFPTALSATVLDAGGVAINNLSVTFTAPSTGPSGTFANGTRTTSANTNASGVATATVYTSNATPGGPYNISVTAGSITNNFSETNTGKTLQSIAVTPANPSVAKGLTQQFTATGTYSDSSTQNITGTVTWASATTSTATITSGGLATAVNSGTSSISATLSGVTGSTVMTVTAATLQSIAVTPANPSVAKGLTQQFTATGTYSDTSTQNITGTVTWASATTSTATITSGGLATAVNAGTSSISATLSGVTGSTVMTVTAATLQSIAVTPANPSVAKGLTQQFTATGTYSDTSTQNVTSTVTWASATTTTATITSGGLATAVNAGTSTISATLSGVTGSTVMTVTAAVLQSIAVTPANPSVGKGLTQQFTATGTYSDNSTQNLTGTVTWASATTTAATITSGGLATAVNAGTSTISATLSGVTGSTVMTVTAATLQSIAVTPANPSVAKGLTRQFTATGTYSDTSTQNLTGTVTWASATTSTATITSGGLATAVNVGTSSISATLSGVTGSTVMTVTAAVLQSIAVTPANPSVGKGLTQQFTATGTYSDNSTQNVTSTVTWASATTTTATITSGGLATAVNAGTSTISATLSGVTGSTVMTVTTASLQSIAVTPANPSVPKGLAQQFTATGTYSDSSTQNLTGTVTWASATTSTATITSGGLATAVNVGTSTISATLSGVTGSTVMTVTTAALLSIAVTPPNPSIANGLTQQFAATGTFSDTSTQNLTSLVTWASATTTTATINATGLATAANVGTSIISATLGGVSGSTLLTVTAGTTPPTVVSFNVLFGIQSYNVTGSPRNRLPWQITGIRVVFSAPITTGDLNSLGGVTPTGFSGLGTNTLTWTIAPISLGQFTATLAGSGLDALADVNGGALGGGAGATQLLRVLYGDFNDDGVVNAADQTSVLVARAAPYNVFADMNGNGVVDTADVQIVRTQIGNTLP